MGSPEAKYSASDSHVFANVGPYYRNAEQTQMKRALLWMLLLSLCGQAQATQFKAGQVELVSRYQTVEGDLAVACGLMKLDGAVNGDLITALRTLNLTGQVGNDLWAVARNVLIAGQVGDDVRVLADSLIVTGRVGSDVTAACRHFVLGETGVVEGALALACEQAFLRGRLVQEALIRGSRINIAGTIDGDVKLYADSVAMLPSARISGDLVYTSPNLADIAPGAQILGTTNWISSEPRPKLARQLAALTTALRLALFFGLLICGALLVGLFPQWANAVSRTIADSPWVSLGVGLAFLICGPIVAILLGISVAGIPLAVFVGMMYALFLYASRIFVALLVGRAIFNRLRKAQQTSSVLAVLLGLLVVSVLSNLPHLGRILALLIALAGTGALVLSTYRLLTQKRTLGPDQAPSA